jgi:uncharacterized protein YkwD
MLFKQKTVIGVMSMVSLCAMVACGGGGGGASPTAGPAVTTAPAPNPTNTTLVTTVPAAGYAAASEELAAFNLLNAERGRCGFGLLAQNGQLDAAAKAHNDYQIVNNTASHFQNQQQFPTGFTGARASDRALTAGYIDAGEVADEFTFASGTTDKTGIGERGVRGLLSAPYHLAGLMDGYRDVGMSARSSADTTPAGANARVILHINAAYKQAAGPQLIAAGSVATYPCAGSAGVNRQLKNETPNPVPGRDLALNPIGTPIYVSTRAGDVLTISSATMTETVAGTPVALRAPITASSDPASIYKSHQGYVAPDGPLKATTEYTVTVTGTANGVAFTTASFRYTTGN